MILTLSLLVWSFSPSVFSVRPKEVEVLCFDLGITFNVGVFTFLVLVASITIMVYCSYYIRGEFSYNYYLVVIGGFILRMFCLLYSSRWNILIIS